MEVAVECLVVVDAVLVLVTITGMNPVFGVVFVGAVVVVGVVVAGTVASVDACVVVVDVVVVDVVGVVQCSFDCS